MSLHVIILAAGQGTRMKSDLPKVVHPVAGKPMLQRVIDTANSLGAEAIHVVVGHGAEQVKQCVSSNNINWCMQEQQLGTGHAVAQALPSIPESATVLILYGDVPLTRAHTLAAMTQSVSTEKMSLLTVQLEDPAGYGRIIRDANGNIKAIVEQKDANEVQRQIDEVNTGILAISEQTLRDCIPKLSNNNSQGEYYLTDVIELAVTNGCNVEGHQPQFEQEVQGVNSRLQLCELECWYQSQLAEQLMLDGVTLFDPHRIDIRGELTCGKDTIIDVNCVFEGTVIMGERVSIGPNCVIKNTRIGNDTIVLANSLIEDSVIGAHVSIGPFARMRPGTVLEDRSKLGNFVETKNTTVGEGSKINHLSYIGDTTIGVATNIGAGTITCNYDGVNKFKTSLGDRVFIGSNTSLVAPVKIDNDATVGAGSTITGDVSCGQLAVARSRQKNIDGWAKPTKK